MAAIEAGASHATHLFNRLGPIAHRAPGLAGGVHCGRCSKCRERQQAFAAAGVADPAGYVAKGMATERPRNDHGMATE